MADPAAGQQAVKDYLTSLGIDPNAIGGGAGAADTNPFSGSDIGKKSLYRGQKIDPRVPAGLPPALTGSTGLSFGGQTKVYNVVWGGHSVAVRAPDLGPDIHVVINSTIGENPSREDLRKAPPTSQVRIWVELRGKDNKSIWQQGIDSGAVSGDGLGRFAQDVNTQTLLGRGGAVMKQPGSPDVSVDIDPYKNPQGGALGVNIDDTGTIEDELKSLYKMKPGEIRKYKTQLWLAGYYGRETPLDAVNMSVLTSDDIKSFSDIMLQASRYFAAGKKITWQDLLSQQAADPSNAKQGKKDVQPIELTDPAAITAAANKTGKELLGRNPSPSDVLTIIQAIHNKETVLGTARNEQQGGTVENVSAGGDIEQYFRDKYPQETMAVDWGAAAADWEQMLRTPAGQPGTVTPVAQNR